MRQEHPMDLGLVSLEVTLCHLAGVLFSSNWKYLYSKFKNDNIKKKDTKYDFNKIGGKMALSTPVSVWGTAEGAGSQL